MNDKKKIDLEAANLDGSNTSISKKFVVSEYDPFGERTVTKLIIENVKPTLWTKDSNIDVIDSMGNKEAHKIAIKHRLTLEHHSYASKDSVGSGISLVVNSLTEGEGPRRSEEITGKQIAVNVDSENIDIKLTQSKVDRIVDNNKRTIGLKSRNEFKLINESDLETIVNAKNIEIRYQTNTDQMDLGNAIENNVGEAFKVFYNQLIDENKFIDILPSDEDIKKYNEEYKLTSQLIRSLSASNGVIIGIVVIIIILVLIS